MVDLKAWGASAAGAWGVLGVFHKRIADGGKNVFLWISLLKWGAMSLVLWPRLGFWVKLRVLSSEVKDWL